MLTIRWDFPHLSPRHYSDDSFSSIDRQFHTQIVDLVRVRATRRQLGLKFDGYQLIVNRDDHPIAIEFRFLGENGHGASHTVRPFMRDLVAELRATHGVEPEVRPKDMFGEL